MVADWVTRQWCGRDHLPKLTGFCCSSESSVYCELRLNCEPVLYLVDVWSWNSLSNN